MGQAASFPRDAMRILFITPYFSPDYAASSPVYAAFAAELANKGHEVTVVTGMPYYGRERLWEGYEGKLLVREQVSGYKIVRLYTYVSARQNLPARIFSLWLFNMLSFFHIIVTKGCDVAFIPNPFIQAGLALHFLATLRKVPVVFSVEDIYPDVAVRVTSFGKWFAPLLGALEKSCYRRARFVRVLSGEMRDQLRAAGVPDDKLLLVPNLADTDFIRPLPRNNRFREKYGIAEDTFVVMYAGNMGLSSGLEVVIEAAELLREERDVLFLLIGEGVRRLQLQEAAAARQLPNVRFVPFQPREELPWVLAAADLSLVTLAPGIANESLPSKTYWLLASGRPVVAVAPKGAALAELVERARCGVRVDSNRGLADTIRRLRADSAARARMGQQGRDFVVANFSRQAICDQLEAVLLRAAGLR